ncbi:MAG TPA: proline racemase family protein, partial [Longimicrobiales bacterium]
WPASVEVIDSHTEGEPTRVVIAGWPPPAGGTMAERRADRGARFDHLRRAVVQEPRGHEAVVGALLTPPVEPDSQAGVVFFNNVGYLGMCGHGLIGVVRTLVHLGRWMPDAADGAIRIDTPVGTVGAVVEADGSVCIRNVPSYCHAKDVAVEVPGIGRVVGDVAWGGNWFFLTELPEPPLDLAHVDELTAVTRRILAALRAQGITGADGAEIDHVELSGPPSRSDADGKNFVLCPGGAYDRSPCGTGTSAKMACLYARGALALEAEWRQESITGSRFTGWLTAEGSRVIPHIRGRAFITGRTTLYFDPDDPFRAGIPAS